LSEEEAAKAYLRKVTVLIGFLNKKAQKEAYTRGLAVLPEVMSLKEYAFGLPLTETRDIARQEFLVGVQRYLIGFYEDSIHHSTLSIEMSLLIRLDEELTPQRKSELHAKINSRIGAPFSLTFGDIFSICRGKDCPIIKDKELERIIAELIKTRNTHIHASNLTSASILSMKESISEIDRGIKELEIIETSLFGVVARKWLPKAKDTLVKSRSTIDSLPSFEWCTKDKQRVQTQSNVTAFFDEQFTEIEKIRKTQGIGQSVRLGLNSGTIVRDLSQDSYSKRKALETIHQSFKVLKEIGFLKETSS
jgi:hypothetical protein